MLRTNLSQEYNCPLGSDSDINEPNLVHHGQKFYCHWCDGEHTAGVDVQVSTIRDWRDYPALPQSAEELQALINEDDTPKITNQELHALRKKVATYEARDALGLIPLSAPSEKYDDTLLPFLTLMRQELHANASKGDRPGWLKLSANQALLEIYWHAAKLSAAVKNNDGPAIIEHSADVANTAMMTLDICGGFGFPLDAAKGNRE